MTTSRSIAVLSDRARWLTCRWYCGALIRIKKKKKDPACTSSWKQRGGNKCSWPTPKNMKHFSSCAGENSVKRPHKVCHRCLELWGVFPIQQYFKYVIGTVNSITSEAKCLSDVNLCLCSCLSLCSHCAALYYLFSFILFVEVVVYLS